MANGDSFRPPGRPDAAPRDAPSPTTGAGVLAIRLTLRAEASATIPGIGRVRFPVGEYVYAGRGHLRAGPRVGAPRAHVDHVLGLAAETRRLAVSDASPCALAIRLARFPGALPVVRFGVTACDCLSHLFAFLPPDAAPDDAAVAA